MISRQSAELDGSSVTFTIGKTEFRTVKVAYGDKLTPEKVIEQGQQTVSGFTSGAYDPGTLKVTMTEKRYRSELLPALAKNGFGNQKMAIVVGRSAASGDRDSDEFKNARLISPAVSTESGGKGLDVELEFIHEQIFWTSERKTLNQLDAPIVAPGLSGSL